MYAGTNRYVFDISQLETHWENVSLKKTYRYKMLYPLIPIPPSILLRISALILSALILRKILLMQGMESDINSLFLDTSVISGATPVSRFGI